MTRDELQRIKEIHAVKHLNLVPSVGLAGRIDINGNAVVVVSELLALAEKGLKYEDLQGAIELGANGEELGT